MKPAIFILFLSLFFYSNGYSQKDSLFVENSIELKNNGELFGTLTLPKGFSKGPVALIIAGSGPTDRNGNNPMMKNESLKYLALELARQGIASLRFDKRGIGESIRAMKTESALRFEDYINDAAGWIRLLKKDTRFSKVYVIGHSEGSLIGMIASQKIADGYISLAGPGRSADKILKDQLVAQTKAIKEATYPIIDSLVKGKTVTDVNSMFYALFRPSVQPYLISWFKYDPAKEIKKLDIPVLILQGEADLQVGVEEARILHKANRNATVVTIPKMNHILKIIEGEKAVNYASYSNPNLPVSKELVNAISEFIKKLK